MGTKLEPIIKELVEEHFGIELTVDKTHYMHDDYDYFRLEFDALDYKNKIIYEFKNTEQDEEHLLENYYPQVQFAMFISGWDTARICYLRNGWDLGFVEVERDENFIENMVEAGKYYWTCVRDVVEPDLDKLDAIAAEIDFYRERQPREIEEIAIADKDLELLHKWGKIKREIDLLQIEESRMKGYFADKWGKYKDDQINYSNAEYTRLGNYDISALKKDYPDIDFEAYRKPGSKYQRQTLKYKAKEVKINREEDIV